ncbi:hypothetical protein HHI36_020647 [Cryptolaemus montrouzieri]|uniref:Retrotransposon gag domain-containing protein n=1 Tax=Cryptolaemus montrouzieri TaxID=559131 RepID=A0ABD2NBD7_9CUCU
MSFHIPKPLHFEGDFDNWREWKREFESYLKTSGKHDEDSDVKMSILLNCIGDEALDIFYFFKDSQKNDYESVISAYDKYFRFNKNIVFESFKFHNMFQKENQSIGQYIKELRKQAEHCDFECNNVRCSRMYKERMIRDQLINGIYDKNVQRRLMKLRHLTTDKIVEYCRSVELSVIQLKHLNSEIEREAWEEFEEKPFVDNG